MADDRVEVGLAELRGIHLCDAPRCGRQLRPGQGMRTTLPGRMLHTCYGTCGAWATGELERSNLS